MKFFQKNVQIFARQVGFEPTNNGFGDRPLNHSGTDAYIIYNVALKGLEPLHPCEY